MLSGKDKENIHSKWKKEKNSSQADLEMLHSKNKCCEFYFEPNIEGTLRERQCCYLCCKVAAQLREKSNSPNEIINSF